MYKATITIEVEAENLMPLKHITELIDLKLRSVKPMMRLIDPRLDNKNIKSCNLEVVYEKDGVYLDHDEEEIEV